MDISVVMPVYNAEKFVGEALTSILQQTYKEEVELIVIDDGSTDESLLVVKQHLAGHPKAVVVATRNEGVVAACNAGLNAARGEFVFRMDADDIAHPERFTRQMAYLRQHPKCVVLGTGILLTDPDMRPIVTMDRKLSHQEIDDANLSGIGSAICHPTAAIRRDVAVKLGGYQRQYECAEDLDLFLRMAEVGELANLADVLLDYRQHLGSVGHAKRKQQTRGIRLAIADARRRRGLAQAEPPVCDEGYASKAAIHRMWAWMALQGGHPKTARKHAFMALALQPLNGQNPRLLACAIRGR